jgi:hypothetical protein
MSRGTSALALVLSASAIVPLVSGQTSASLETLRATGGLPAHIAGAFEEPIGFQQAPSGEYFVFDRRSHTVFSVAPKADAPKRIIRIGAEPGHLLRPTAFDFAADGTFVVADAPGLQERIQIFFSTGASLGGFRLPGRTAPRITIGNLVLNGVGSIEYTGSSIFLSLPETGALITEYGVDGYPRRSFGQLRRTGHEKDREVHLAMNAGVPIVNPKGGFYLVFLAGVPMFRRYDTGGRMVFERHVEGVELDEFLRGLPGTWPVRRTPAGEVPVVRPTVLTAAADLDGNLWISLSVGYTYVYDPNGDKRRTIQFRAAGPISPTSLFFTSDGRVLVTPGCYAFRR